MLLLVRHIMENQFTLAIMASGLILVPIAGIWAIHKYNWQHWEPFNRESHSSPTHKS